MSAADFLKKFRDKSKPDESENGGDEKEAVGSRILKLSGDEMKQLGESKPGEDMEITVRGRLEDGEFHVMSVGAAGGDQAGGISPMDVMGGPPQGMMPPGM